VNGVAVARLRVILVAKDMAETPNLFQSEWDAETIRCYERFLSRLCWAGRTKRTIAACRQIRRFAASNHAERAFTYFWELEAYGRLQDFDSMWQVLRAWERAAFKKRLNLTEHRWNSDDFHQLIYYYGPILYLRGRYGLGRRLMETALSMAADQKGWSFEMLWHVYKPINRPASIYEVTLSNFYSASGRKLTEWPLWDSFVDNLDSRVLRMSQVPRPELRKDSALLRSLFAWITGERRRRLSSGTTDGLRDLTEPAGKVRNRQQKIKEKLLKLDEDPGQEERERRLVAIFPELANLPATPH
jgi:hypothetical protein